MAKCKCGTRNRIVSNVVRAIDGMSGAGVQPVGGPMAYGAGNNNGCTDVCANPIFGDSNQPGVFAPVIYDEIGINLCTTFELGTDIATAYPTVTNAAVRVLDAEYVYGEDDVQIEAITGRPNCYVVTLSNLTVQFAVNLYDSAGRLVDTLYPTAVYLPSDMAAPTYDPDTNPSSVEIGIFAPYGLSYDTTGDAPTPVISFIGSTTENNMPRQGVNLFAMATMLDFSTDESTATVGLTLVLQSLYYVGYKLRSAGKIDIPKGSIITPDNTDCRRFVAGDLLNLAIKPLDLGAPFRDENHRKENGSKPGNSESIYSGTVADDTVIISGTTEVAENLT